MKSVLSFLLLVTVATSAFSQTIRRVNNNAGISGSNIYATLQLAHDAAVSGDIIYVEGSPNSYGNLDCTKPLTIIGTGYWLGENGVYPAYNNPQWSKSGDIVFRPGSDNSLVTGMWVEGYIGIKRASNITVRRNSANSLDVDCLDGNNANPASYASVSDVIFEGNYIRQYDLNARAQSFNGLDYTISNLSVRSNVMRGIIYTNGALISSASITNNIFYSNNYWCFQGVWNSTIHNNIFTYGGLSPLSVTNCTVSFNYSMDADFLPAGSGNVNAPAFAPSPFVGGNNQDSQYILAVSSAAIGAGVGGVDCGIFGGSTPYVLSGVPSYPTINSLITTGTGSTTAPLGVTISTKSNN
jgi:hypothetical protein